MSIVQPVGFTVESSGRMLGPPLPEFPVWVGVGAYPIGAKGFGVKTFPIRIRKSVRRKLLSNRFGSGGCIHPRIYSKTVLSNTPDFGE